MLAIEYKKFHESFMQNNHGSTALHTFFCIFFTVQCAVYISIKPQYPPCYQFVYEYFVMVFPMILAHTILAEYIFLLNLIIFIILLNNFRYQNFRHILKKTFMKQNFFPNNRVGLISCLRGLTYLITVLCILAVDFQDFPRYLAKTERYGYSLMDTGVGLFVVVSGIVYKDISKESCMNIVKGNIKIITILIILGIGRFVSVKQLDYHEHVTEYGVHWNFFFTIAVCKIISTIVLKFSNRAVLLCILTLIFHEFILYIGLQDWVFGDSPRNSLISANREGISSCLGYVSIYLYAVHLKHVLLDKTSIKLTIQLQLLVEAILLWMLVYFVDLICPTSRTLANAAYCLYMDAILVTITAVMYFVTVFFEDSKDAFQVPIILSYINTNGLSYFLIANLLTGAINLTIRTLLVHSSTSFVILNVYMVVTLGAIVYLKSLGLKI